MKIRKRGIAAALATLAVGSLFAASTPAIADTPTLLVWYDSGRLRDYSGPVNDWAKANGVLPMPEGYDPIQQVIINSLVFVYWPRYQWHLAGLGVLLLLSGVWLWRRRR